MGGGAAGCSAGGEHERSVTSAACLRGKEAGADNIGEQPPSTMPPSLLLGDDLGLGDSAARNGEQASSTADPIFLQPPTRVFRGDLAIEPGCLPRYPSYEFRSDFLCLC
jgi:hypothetical protein